MTDVPTRSEGFTGRLRLGIDIPVVPGLADTAIPSAWHYVIRRENDLPVIQIPEMLLVETDVAAEDKITNVRQTTSRFENSVKKCATKRTVQ